MTLGTKLFNAKLNEIKCRKFNKGDIRIYAKNNN